MRGQRSQGKVMKGAVSEEVGGQAVKRCVQNDCPRSPVEDREHAEDGLEDHNGAHEVQADAQHNENCLDNPHGLYRVN